MKRLTTLSLLTAVLFSVTFFAISPSTAEERGERERERGKGRGTSIEGIMKAVHGRNGLMKSLSVMLDVKDAKNVKWDAVRATTKKILPLANDLGKRKPDRGNKESWAELTAIYADSAKELDDAAAKKDLTATKDAYENLNSSCTKCHDLHKEKGR